MQNAMQYIWMILMIIILSGQFIICATHSCTFSVFWLFTPWESCQTDSQLSVVSSSAWNCKYILQLLQWTHGIQGKQRIFPFWQNVFGGFRTKLDRLTFWIQLVRLSEMKITRIEVNKSVSDYFITMVRLRQTWIACNESTKTRGVKKKQSHNPTFYL